MVTTGMLTRSMAAANASGSCRGRRPATKKNEIMSQPNNTAHIVRSKARSTKPTKTINKLEPRPKEALEETNGCQESKRLPAQNRRSMRIAQRLTVSTNCTTTHDPIASSVTVANGPLVLKPTRTHQAPVYHGKSVTATTHAVQNVLHTNNKKNRKLATSSQKTTVRKDKKILDPSITNIQHITTDDAQVEIMVTKEEYMIQVNRRIKAAERRERLRGAVGAPFPWSQFRRHLYTEFIRFHVAVTAGRVKDIHEALQLPLDDKFWSKKVNVGPITHRDAGKCFRAMKQKAIQTV